MVKCPICLNAATYCFTTAILQTHEGNYYSCQECKSLFVTDPCWLEEAYAHAIAAVDTGIVQRNLRNTQIASLLIQHFFDPQAMFVDFAGGNGLFVRLMRDLGYNFFWADKYCENSLASGFEYTNQSTPVMITCFECFEHLQNPMKEIDEMLKLSSSILFSTQILPEPTPKDWWYFAPEFGQHITFYSLHTLVYIARRFNKRLLTNGIDIHLLTDSQINHASFREIVQKASKHSFFLGQNAMPSKTFADHQTIKSQLAKSIA